MSAAAELLASTVARPTFVARSSTSSDFPGAAKGREPAAGFLWELLVPSAEGLFDEDVTVVPAGTQAQLDYDTVRTRRARLGTGRSLRLVPDIATRPAATDVGRDLPLFTDRAPGPGSVSTLVPHPDAGKPTEGLRAARLHLLPDPQPFAGQLVQAVVEVLTGVRPIGQLLTQVNEQIYVELAALAPVAVAFPTVGRVRAVVVRPQDRPRVRSVHVCRPADGVAEVAARVPTKGRSRAIASRLEEWRGRWRCSALVLG